MSAVAEIEAQVAKPASPEQIQRLEARLLNLPQADVPLVERFAPGVYLREVFMAKDTFVIGHEHRTEHFNVVLTGRASVLMNGEVSEIVAPCTFVSKPGVRKVLYIHEDMRWQTIHPTEETDPLLLEDTLIVKSPAYLEHQAALDLHELRALVADSEQSKKEENK
jgi:hypothetical protein